MFGGLLGGNPQNVPVPVTGTFPQIDLSKIPPQVLQRMMLDPRLRQMLTMKGDPPIQRTPLGPVPGLLDQRLAEPRPTIGDSLLLPAGDVIDWQKMRGLLHNPDLLADQASKRNLPVPAGGAAVIRPPALNMGVPPNVPPHWGRMSPADRALWTKHADAAAKDSVQTSFGGVPLKPTAQDLSAIKKNARAKSEAYKRGKRIPGELDPAAFGKYADKVNPTMSAATIDAQLAGNARALKDMSIKQQAQALTNKWSAYAFHAGMNPAKAAEAVKIWTDAGMSDQLIKFNLALLKQKGACDGREEDEAHCAA
jgi:hypothetical protein